MYTFLINPYCHSFYLGEMLFFKLQVSDGIYAYASFLQLFFCESMDDCIRLPQSLTCQSRSHYQVDFTNTIQTWSVVF